MAMVVVVEVAEKMRVIDARLCCVRLDGVDVWGN